MGEATMYTSPEVAVVEPNFNPDPTSRTREWRGRGRQNAFILENDDPRPNSDSFRTNNVPAAYAVFAMRGEECGAVDTGRNNDTFLLRKNIDSGDSDDQSLVNAGFAARSWFVDGVPTRTVCSRGTGDAARLEENGDFVSGGCKYYAPSVERDDESADESHEEPHLWYL
ncbi:hypothetical protein H0H81_009876 [Sphagnurus paluster]|uniref:Uncharacterized protein n=1 Tax=Sphagnurus paluster TaxID=117069 RepID=A0A9P7FW21_9AGAR|nr:hypothetical protein H0H81_009876 [Sphagnurus paluster]